MSLIDSGLRSPTGGATAQNDLARNGRALPALGYRRSPILLNTERVPTLRGGAEWRPSSVQAAAGYRRPGRNRAPALPGPAPVRNSPAA